MSANPVAAIEQATLAAVRPAKICSIDRWLIPLDADQTVGRACSAVPLHHPLTEADLDSVQEVLRIFDQHQLARRLRLPVDESDPALIAGLKALGLTPVTEPTDVMLAQTSTLISALQAKKFSVTPTISVSEVLPESWLGLYTQTEASESSARARLAVLGRAQSAIYMTVNGSDQIAQSALMASFDPGLVSFHGLRTLPTSRRQGLVSQLMLQALNVAQQRDLATAFLQVESDNAIAISLYRSLGFDTRWRYVYWTG